MNEPVLQCRSIVRRFDEGSSTLEVLSVPNIEFWNLNDKLVYWVLFPSLLFYKMATMELSGDLLGEFATVIYLGFASAVIFALVAGRLFGLDRPAWTSVLQGCARHNTFIALAVAERVFGSEGLALAALITALLIPVTAPSSRRTGMRPA